MKGRHGDAKRSPGPHEGRMAKSRTPTKDQLLKELAALRKRMAALAASETQQAEAALRTAKEEWEQSFNALTDDVCILDLAGLILRANKAMRDRFEHLHGNLVGLDYRLVYYGTGAPDYHPPWEAVLSGASSVVVEHWFPKLDGWFQVSCYPLYDVGGSQWGAVSVVKDITERKRIEEALRDIAQRAPAAGSAAFFRSLIKHLAKALEVDYAFIAEFTGGAGEDVRTVAVCAHGEIKENFVYHLPETPGAKIVSSNLCCYASGVRQQFPKDPLLAEWEVESFIGSPLFNSAGRSVGLVVAMDTAPLRNRQLAESILGVFAVRASVELERKRAEEALRDSEERYRAIAENTYDLISETSETGQYLYLSPNHKDVLGYEPRELQGQSIFERVHPDDLPAVKAEFERGMRTLKPGQAEFRLRTKAGEWRWFDGTGKAFRTATGEVRAVVVSRDITDRKQIEEERLRASKLESLGVFAGGIAHDFNNLLAAIIGNISLAKLSVEPGNELHKSLAEAEKASLKAKGLTQQLLTFAKGGAPVKRPTSIGDLLRESAGFALRGSNVRPEFSLPDNLWPVEVDEGQMSQVIHNLVLNAQQAMPDGGIITIGGENLTVGADRAEQALPLREGKYVKLAIRDQGSGIAKEHLPKIFDPYFTTKQKGSGLGLATSYSIIKNHEGHISVDSEVGVGTTFVLYLPAFPLPLPAPVEIEEKPRTGRGKILIMDDEEPIRDLLVRIMTHCGYEAETARDGAETIALYKQAKDAGRPFEAVIMDLTIPGGMGGKDTIAKLIDIDPQVKAIVSSGYAHDPVMANYKQYGFRGVVAKPYKITELSEVLETVILGRAQ